MKRLWAAAVICVVAIACGGVQTSVPAGSTVASLSVEQTRQLCRDRQKYFETTLTSAERKTFSCSLGSLIGGAIGSAFGGVDAGIAACTKAYTDCQAGQGSSSDGGTSDPCGSLMADSTCTATVGDFNTCYTEQIEGLRPLTKGEQCATLATSDGGSPTATKTTACDKIAPSCKAAQSFGW